MPPHAERFECDPGERESEAVLWLGEATGRAAQNQAMHELTQPRNRASKAPTDSQSTYQRSVFM